ncbi:Deoxynucleotidyltransferase terminal-interacting protein 2 [Yarrowia sp. C11]|nr:Deoxynucleotidyltransferase terminal-interacting protein 2 [Yarrowia sp. C11]KAG5363982.1 Deoxynucleotidyltransferase terminal-interacting protein 2 [Yarrowia sp. E02]
MARKNPARGSKVNLAPEPVEDVPDKVLEAQNEQEGAEAEVLEQEEEKEEEKEENDKEGSDSDDSDSDSDSDESDSESESESEDLNFDDITSLLDASTNFQTKSEEGKSLDEITERYSRLPKIDGGVEYGSGSLTEKGLLQEDHYDYTKEDNKNKFAFRVIQDPHQVKLDKKKAKDNTAGDKWFGMKAPDMTPELKMDMELLKMRNVLDPKRFYKKSDSKKDPKFFEMGTIVEGNTEFFSARLTKKERKQTFAQELLGDEDSQKYFKRKYAEIGDSKDVGRKKHFQNLKDLRKKRR